MLRSLFTFNVLERFVWTFIQAAVGSLPVTFSLTGEALSAIGWTALTAGLAATVSLAKNLTAEGIVIQQTSQVMQQQLDQHTHLAIGDDGSVDLT